MQLSNKTILIISPNNWGKIHVSKHHYAIELAKRGNKVFYLEPSISKNKKGFFVRSEEDGIKVVTQSMHLFAEFLRFKVRWFYNVYCYFFIRKLMNNINQQFDIVWCFDTNLYSNLKWFNAQYCIYHPVDLAVYDFQRKISTTADIVFTVSENIVKDFLPYNNKVFLINHGLNIHFKNIAEKKLMALKKEVSTIQSEIKVAFVGNLLRPEINRDLILDLILSFPKIIFNFWGPRILEESNIDGEMGEDTNAFIKNLYNAPNVILHGVLTGPKLFHQLISQDILLLPLNITQNYDGSNSHKIIEYLSTGKVIVSNFVSTYSNLNLLEMAASDKKEDIKIIFDKVRLNIVYFNSFEKMRSRIEFALNNAYNKQIDRIEEYINNV